MLALVLTSTQGAYSDGPNYPSISFDEFLELTGPYDGGRIQIEAEFVMAADAEFFTTFESDPTNIAAIVVDFYRPGTKADAGTGGTIPELVATGGVVVWEASPPLPIHIGRIWTLKELLTPPAGSTQAQVSGLFSLGYLDSSAKQWFDLGALTPSTGANQNPTVDTPAISPATVTTATKMIAVTVIAADPDGDELSYTWYVNGAPVAGPTPNLNGIEIPGLELGEYTVRVKVEDGKGDPATAETMFKVGKETNEPPEVDLSGRSCDPPPGSEGPEVTHAGR